MFSETTLGFLKKLVHESADFNHVMDSYTYSERFLMAMDLQTMYELLIGETDAPQELEELEPNYIVALCVDFLSMVTTGVAIEKIIYTYSRFERGQIALAIYDIQAILVKNIEGFADFVNLRASYQIYKQPYEIKEVELKNRSFL